MYVAFKAGATSYFLFDNKPCKTKDNNVSVCLSVLSDLTVVPLLLKTYIYIYRRNSVLVFKEAQ